MSHIPKAALIDINLFRTGTYISLKLKLSPKTRNMIPIIFPATISLSKAQDCH